MSEPFRTGITMYHSGDTGRVALRVALLGALATLGPGCGARTGLEELPRPVDAGPDAAPCVPSSPPRERCNAIDDDCDGAIDEGLPYAPIAPAFALRTTEGDTGASELCGSCRWAWDPALAATTSGFVVPFHLGIYGGREAPALFVRRTDARGMPLGEVEQSGMEVPLHLRRLDEAGRDGSSWIDAVLRIGSDDLAGWVVIGPDGGVRTLRASLDRRAVEISSVPMRDGVLAAWRRDETLEASRFDASGRALGVHAVAGRLLAGGGLSVMSLASRAEGEGAVLFVARFVAEPRRFSLHAIRLDVDGNASEPITLLADGATLQLRATRTDGGYLLFDPGNGSEPTARFVDAALRSVSEPVPIDPGVDGSDLAFDYARAPGGGFLAVSTDALVRLDARGRPTASWRGRLAPGDDEGSSYVTSPDLAFREGRAFVAWHGIAADRTPNTVWLREVGCVEP